ncbi:MAG: rod shape-determining protein RodA [Ponticaulis sp.]|nr:rod shape-determining protein RodA [Ponticaulis sp.]
MAYYQPIDDNLLSRIFRLPWIMILVIIGLGVFGVAVLYSATITNPTEANLPGVHAVRVGIAVVFLFVLAMIPLNLWSAVAYGAYFAALLMLLGVEFYGAMGGGAQRWLEFGGRRVQPSEFMKLALLLALARFYHQQLVNGPAKFYHHLIALVMIGAPVALVFKQPDLGTALMLAATGFAVMFFAGLRYWMIILTVAVGICSAPLAYFYVLKDYQRERVLTAIDPSRDPLGAGYQIQQAEIAIGSGGAEGRGYMKGTQSQLDYIPEQHTDFIFTVIAEEFGFVGSVGLLAAWCLVLGIGLAIAGRCRSYFGYLAASGAVVTIAFYVIVNIGMVSGLLPVVGVPLPFISYGGTAMMTVMAALAVICAVNLDRDRHLSLTGLF